MSHSTNPNPDNKYVLIGNIHFGPDSLMGDNPDFPAYQMDPDALLALPVRYIDERNSKKPKVVRKITFIQQNTIVPLPNLTRLNISLTREYDPKDRETVINTHLAINEDLVIIYHSGYKVIDGMIVFDNPRLVEYQDMKVGFYVSTKGEFLLPPGYSHEQQYDEQGQPIGGAPVPGYTQVVQRLFSLFWLAIGHQGDAVDMQARVLRALHNGALDVLNLVKEVQAEPLGAAAIAADPKDEEPVS